MKKHKYQQIYNTPYQLKIPLEISKKIKISDAVYTFCEVMEHIYIDGTKIAANANKYSWVWKKSSIKHRQNTFNKITSLLKEINTSLIYQNVEFEIRTEYAIEYMKQIIEQYIKLTGIQPECIVRGRGHHKTTEQRNYDKLVEYTEALKKYADCSNCPHKDNCCKCKGNRIIRLNEELTSVHQEVLCNLNSTKDALLRMNRSIQAEGAFGTIKWNRAYTRARRRGLKGINLEILMICCGFNLHKYHLKSHSCLRAA